MNIIEFNGDPMLQLEKFEDMDKYIFYLNQESFDEIKSYSELISENIPEYFNDKKTDFVLFAAGGTDDEGKEFPDTYIGISSTSNSDYPYYFSAIYASDFQYTKPENGEIIFLKKNDKQLKQ
jgi:hypothetical protein